MRGRACKVYGVLVLLVISCAPTRAYYHLKPLAQLTHEFPNVTCNFESPCSWKWSTDYFTNTSSSQLQEKFKEHDPKVDVPTADGDRNENGEFILVFFNMQRNYMVSISWRKC